jgi:putative ATP-dependent endonuclease of OLD family
MHLSNIKLWNFRRFGSDMPFSLSDPNLNLDLTSGVNVIIGENDSGKSTIIDAIKFVLKTHSYDWVRLEQEDFYKNSFRLRIELIFYELSDDEAKNFTEWLGWIGESDKAKPFLRLIYDAKRNSEDYSITPGDVKAGVDDEGNQLSAEAREYLKVTYLKPLRDAQSELTPKKNSRLSQILQGHEAFKGKEDSHLLVKIFKDFNLSVEKYFEGLNKENVELPKNELKGKELKKGIDRFIQAFYEANKESNFGVVGGTLKNILEKLELSLKDEINPGLGTLNRLFMSSELLHLQKKDWNGVRLGLIEEVEAHLHPQAQMQVIEALQKERNIQLILTTHSPNIGSKILLENLIICDNNNPFPLGPNNTKLDPDDYIFLERFLDATKANLFFAKGVIFVEGWAEELFLPALVNKLQSQGIIKYNLTEKGVSIVNVGNTAFLRYSRIFLRKTSPYIKIPISIITDVDIREYTKSPKLDSLGNIIKVSGKTLYDYTKLGQNQIDLESEAAIKQLASKYNEQNVSCFIAPNWTFEYCLYKSTSLNNIFSSIIHKVHPQIAIDNLEQELATKLINKSLDKTELAYQLANKLDEDCKKPHPEIIIDENDKSIKYLLDAIKHACRN